MSVSHLFRETFVYDVYTLYSEAKWKNLNLIITLIFHHGSMAVFRREGQTGGL